MQTQTGPLSTFLLDRYPLEAEAVRSLCERVDVCQQQREAASEVVDDVLRARVSFLEDQLAGVGKEVRQQRESVPSAAAKQLQEAHAQSLATLLQSGDATNNTLTTGTRRADPANEPGRCHEVQDWLRSRADTLQSELELAAQLQDRLKELKAQDVASSINAALGQVGQENGPGNQLRMAVQ